MLKPWKEYQQLAASPAGPLPKLVSLKELHDSDDIWLLPAYAQTDYVYDGHAIIQVNEATYHHTAMINRVNQFDAMGPSYNPAITDIFIEERLGKIASAAQRIVANEKGIMLEDGSLSSGRLMVIDALRTVDATYLLAAANPLAVESKLLSMPGTSAHNKGMAIDLTLTYFNTNENLWCDAQMLGHIDHPDMTTNHRNYKEVSNIEQHNRLYLEQVMLRGAFECGMLLAPLREEFWDFRFPEDELDIWRVLEAICRAAQISGSFEICAKAIEDIRALYRSGNKEEAYTKYALNHGDYANKCTELFSSDDAKEKLKTYLRIAPEELTQLGFVFHGGVGLVFDEALPSKQRQANPELHHLFE